MLEGLPDYIKQQLPVTFTRRGAIDRSMLDTLTHTVMHGGSFTAAAEGIADACKRREQRYQQLYMHFQLSQRQGGQQALIPALLQQSQSGSSQAANSSKHLQVSTSFQPSRQYLSTVWLEAMRPNIDWANRYMSTVKGRFWCMDHTFATAKCIRDAEQQSVYKAVLTVVNEHSQLVAQWFTHTTSLYEVRKGLQLLRDRYKGDDVEVSQSADFLQINFSIDASQIADCSHINNQDVTLQGPEYIWVDNSDQSGQILQSIFPSVKRVLEDSTHLMRRYMRTLTPGHPLNREFTFICLHSALLHQKTASK